MSRRAPPTRPSAYALAAWGTREEVLAALRDPARTADDVAALAPGYQEPDADTELVEATLAHPAVSAGVVGRYATHRSAAVRAVVATHPLVPSTALQALALDPVEQIASTAQHRLDHPEPPAPPPPVSRPGRR
ncbi:hypothetical protein [Cellulomonas soli]